MVYRNNLFVFAHKLENPVVIALIMNYRFLILNPVAAA